MDAVLAGVVLCWATLFFWPMIEDMGMRGARKALALTIGATPVSDLAARSTVTVNEFVTTTATITAHQPARTLWLPRVTHTMTPPAETVFSPVEPLLPPVEPVLPPVDPVFSPAGTADTIPGLSPEWIAVAVLLALGFASWFLFARSLSRRAQRESALLSTGAYTVEAESPERFTANGLWDDITVFDAFWSDANSLKWIQDSSELLGNLADLKGHSDRTEMELVRAKEELKTLKETNRTLHARAKAQEIIDANRGSWRAVLNKRGLELKAENELKAKKKAEADLKAKMALEPEMALEANSARHSSSLPRRDVPSRFSFVGTLVTDSSKSKGKADEDSSLDQGKAKASDASKGKADDISTPDQEKVKASDASVSSSDGSKAPSQLSNQGPVPGTKPSDDDASKAPSTTETTVGAGETKEHTDGGGGGEGPEEPDKGQDEKEDEKEESDEENDDGSKDGKNGDFNSDDDDDSQDPHDQGGSGALTAQSQGSAKDNTGVGEERSTPENDRSEPVNDGENGQQPNTLSSSPPTNEQPDTTIKAPESSVEPTPDVTQQSVADESVTREELPQGNALPTINDDQQPSEDSVADKQSPVADKQSPVANQQSPVADERVHVDEQLHVTETQERTDNPNASSAPKSVHEEFGTAQPAPATDVGHFASTAQELNGPSAFSVPPRVAELAAQLAQSQLTESPASTARESNGPSAFAVPLRVTQLTQSQFAGPPASTAQELNEPSAFSVPLRVTQLAQSQLAQSRHAGPPPTATVGSDLASPAQHGANQAQLAQNQAQLAQSQTHSNRGNAMDLDDESPPADEMEDVQATSAASNDHGPTEEGDVNMTEDDVQATSTASNDHGPIDEGDVNMDPNDRDLFGDDQMDHDQGTSASANAVIDLDDEMVDGPNAPEVAMQDAPNSQATVNNANIQNSSRNPGVVLQAYTAPDRPSNASVAPHRTIGGIVLPFGPASNNTTFRNHGQNPAAERRTTGAPSRSATAGPALQSSVGSSDPFHGFSHGNSEADYDEDGNPRPPRPSETLSKKDGKKPVVEEQVSVAPVAPVRRFTQPKKPSETMANREGKMDISPLVPAIPTQWPDHNAGAGPFRGTAQKRVRSGSPVSNEHRSFPTESERQEEAPPFLPSPPPGEASPRVPTPPGGFKTIAKTKDKNVFFNMDRPTRDERLDSALSAANISFNQWDGSEDADLFTEAERREVDGHIQQISWATDWFIFAREQSTHAPDHSPMNVLQEMLREVNSLVAQLELLTTTGPESRVYIRHFGQTLRNAYRMREILNEAIKRKNSQPNA